MEIVKTLLFFSDLDEGLPRKYPTIWYDNAWWLVGSWLRSQDGKTTMPELLVQLPEGGYQEVNSPDYRFVLTHAIATAVLRGEERDGYTFSMYPSLAHIPGSGSVQ